MAENKGVNPLFVGLGVLAGAAGALFFSKKQNRVKTTKVMKRAEKSGKSMLSKAIQFAQEAAEDMGALANQDIDSSKPSKNKPHKKTVKKI